MHPAQLHALAEDLFILFEQYGLDAEQFTLNVRLSAEQFEAIKDDFPASPLNFMLSETGTDWTITLGRPMDWAKRDQHNPKSDT